MVMTTMVTEHSMDETNEMVRFSKTAVVLSALTTSTMFAPGHSKANVVPPKTANQMKLIKNEVYLNGQLFRVL
jgi:hypothetical protein